MRGYGVQAEPETGRRWIELAANQELPIAQYEMGLIHQNGEIVPKDEAKAKEWFDIALKNDFTKMQYNAGFSYIEFDFAMNYKDFDFPPDRMPEGGHLGAATVKARLVREGQPMEITTPVQWSVEEVENPKEPWWLRGPCDRHGLSWSTSNRNKPEWTDDVVWGKIPVGSQAKLFDVVGQRTVTVKAATNIDGIDYSAKIKFFFGKGPLSWFGAPVANVQFAKSRSLDFIKGLEQIPPDFFPAVTEVCHSSIKKIPFFKDLLADKFEQSQQQNHSNKSIPTMKIFGILFSNNSYIAANWPDNGYWSNSFRTNNFNDITAFYFVGNLYHVYDTHPMTIDSVINAVCVDDKVNY